MASQFSSHPKSSYETQLRRGRLRRVLLETLERRELLAADTAAPVFAPGTNQDYIDSMITQLMGDTSNSGRDGFGQFNAPGARWSNPVGGVSPNEGDPATITWSIVPDGTIDQTGGGSTQTDLIRFMDNIYGGGSGPVSQRPWFNIFQRAYDRWSELSGLTFVYEPADDGAPIGGGNRGVAGVRGDVRIGGRNIDGNFGTLAFNYFPNSGGNAGFDGDMIIDTNDAFFFNSADGPFGENRGLFNVLMHEAGHGIGLGHTIPVDGTKLMEPSVSFAFLGAQHDDILGAHKLYGDPRENDDTLATATDLGELSNGIRTLSGGSIDFSTDDDWFTFSVPSAGRISLTLEPLGEQYNVGPQGGAVDAVNTLINQDLQLELQDASGNVLALLNAAGVGEVEQLSDFDLTAGGTYHLRVIGEGGEGDDPQLYDLSIRTTGLVGPNIVVQPPRLLSVAPNVGEIFSFNRTNNLELAPNELVFRFDGAQFLDASSFDGIRITRSGFDEDFSDGDEVVLAPGFIGFGDSERVIIARFATALPDDLYRIEVLGVDVPAEGLTAVRNVNGDVLRPRIDGTDRDTLFFDLELGNAIEAVVPQPTSRDSNTGTLLQARDQIEVYFSEGDRMHPADVATGDVAPNPTIVDPSFYQLFADRGTVTNTDDALYTPTHVQYFADRNMALLTFGSNIEQLDPVQDTSFRLRIGTNEARPSAPVVVGQVFDPGSTFDVTGAADLGVLNTISSLEVSERIVNDSAFPLDFPGAPDTPGTREIVDDPTIGESHFVSDSPDADTNLDVQFYNFNKVDPVTTDVNGQPLFSSITPAQEQRAREIFELYGSLLGIQFIETENQGWTIATASIDGPGGTLGQASAGVVGGIGTAIMDAGESWNDEFGANDDPTKISWFGVAMHEIGHMLGLGHATELPPGTILGGLYSNATLGGEPALLSGNPVEPIFPGAADRVNAQYLLRPDSRDIDMYRFEVAPGSAGEFTAEIVAERLPDSSLLDSVLSLYRELPDGSREVIAVNDDYFSEDSFLRLDLQPGTYYLGVSASGNTNYNPEIEDSGLGGVSEGDYRLRTTFRPLEASSIVDEDGTALDGDADGSAGGVFNFWFNAASPNGENGGGRRTLLVDKLTGTAGGDGSRGTPFQTISDAFAAAQPGDIVRLVANGGADGDVSTQEDNLAFEVGTGGLGNQPLQDGATMNVPKGVTVMIDAGVLMKMGRSVIGVGSSTSSGDRSQANLQVLGTPEQEVFFTSYTDENLGVDTDPLATTAQAGDWGGIIFRNALDRAEGRFDSELQGRFVNYVGHANMRFGGGQVPVDGQNTVITPLHMVTASPTLINNTITNSAFAAMSADPNSFEESTFASPRFQANALFTPDYDRVGPEIHGNTVTSNSINGLFVRVETVAGQNTAAQTVSGRWNDTDIVHVVADTLTVAGTPGGPLLETTPPELDVVNISSGGNVQGGQLVAGTAYSYRMTFVDANGNEGVPSAPTQPFTVAAGANAIRLSNLPAAGGDFVARKIYRSNDGGFTFRLVAELDRSSTVHVDSGAPLGAILNVTNSLNRARLDANLVVDPGMTVKLQGGRIVAGISAQLVAEGREGLPVVFTSRQDDRYGAGGTFDTNGDADASTPQPGDWGGLYFGQAGSGSLDHALVTYGGGVTGVGGTFGGFNAIEIHQSDVRIANSTIENNASGTGGPASANRNGFGFNEGAAIFVRGSEPVIVDNIIRDNDEAAISIDPQSMSGNSVKDPGRTTGFADRRAAITENKGPLLRGNALGGNDVNAMVIRGATLTTESVWDDADIVHAVFDEILIPDLYVFGGLRLQSSPNESLVVKFGSGAGLTSNGRPLDIDDRIGGALQVVGAPGFPVVLTSIADDTIGAGFGPDGTAQTDTNNDGSGTVPGAGDWRSLRVGEFSNDRNVAVGTELEPAQSTGAGINGLPSSAQFLGQLATGEKASDDNLRLGFHVVGAINNIDDIDVYSFTGTAGTQVWLDIDRTDISLDSVIELVDSDGNIIAQSDNSLDESTGGLAIFSNPAAIETNHVNAMQNDPFAPRNGGSGLAALNNTFSDFYSTNPRDPGMRLVLPGAAGSVNTYFVRVRSSNIDSLDPGANRADLQDPGKLADGKTEGQYQLQIRLQAMDEFSGSSISFADVRYATAGIEILGGPSHSPLVGEAVELRTNNNTLANALDLGNLLSTDRAALSIAGDLNDTRDVDWYRFDINQTSLQDSGLVQHLATMIDVDYADGLGRANTSLWLFYDDQNGLGNGNNSGIRLVNFGTDSNIADDLAAPTEGSDTDDLSRGTAGLLDAFIGSSHLPSGTYYLAITSNEQISSYLSQYFAPNAGGNPLVRVEPINSVTRLVEDRFGGGTTTGNPPLTVGFSGNTNQVEYTLGNIPLLITQTAPGADNSELITINAFTGQQTSLVSRFPFVEDAAIRGDGTLHGARSPQTGVINDANSGGILDIDTAGDGATTAVTATSGIQTFELDFTQAPPAVASALTPGTGGQRQGVGMEFLGLTYPQEGNTQFLYGVGSRGDGSTSFATFTGTTDARNYVYRLNPGSLQAESNPLADRQDNARIGGAGTQIRERGYIDTSIDVNQNSRAQSITMSAASPFFEPALLSGDQVTLVTPTGTTVFEWQETGSLSATLIADTSPQTDPFATIPNNFYRDGMSFSISDGTDNLTFEVDTGAVLFNTFEQFRGAAYEGATFTLQDQNANVLTWEFDSNNAVAGTNIPIVFDGNTTRSQMSDLILNAINAGNASVADPVLAPWTITANRLPGWDGFNYTDRISLSGDDPAVPPAFSAENAVSRNPLLHDMSILNTFGPLAPGESYDGATFTVTDDNLNSITFEFDTDNTITNGNSRIEILGTDTQAVITQKIVNAINNPDPTVVFNLPGSVWVGGASQHLTANLVTLNNYRALTASAETATAKNPVRLAGGAGTALDATLPVAIEEFYINLDDNQIAPTPSTPGAMDELIAAIDAAPFTVDASQSGSRLILDNAVSADFDETPPILFSTSTGTPGAVVLNFNSNMTANQLNNILFGAVSAVEPGALQMVDGHIWVPGRSFFNQFGTDDRLDTPPNGNSSNAKLSEPVYGYVTGLAFAGSTMYGVSENGDLYRVGGTNFNPNSTNNNGDFIETIYNPITRRRVDFVSLASGPRNAENAGNFSEDPNDLGLDDILFGIDSSGVLYAFDTLGRPAHVFQDAAWFIQTQATSPSGLAFSNLDVNLWHTTQNNRNTDDGHGTNISFDGSRRTQENGNDSLYFGFENPNDPQIQVGNWTGVNNPGGNFPGYDATIYDTYDFPGGASGAIVSNTLDLSSYSPGDKPFLYFNYYLETENANANNPGDNNFMKDAFRVFVSGNDGEWKLVATNNSDYDATRLVGQRDEFDYPFEEDVANFTTHAVNRQVSELFDAGVGGAPDSWRQARIDLSRFAGDQNVRIRFDFNTAGSAFLGSTGGEEIVAVPGDQIREGDRFLVNTTTFEFDLGLVLQIPSGGRLTNGQTFEVEGVTYTFAANNFGNNVQFGPNDSAEAIAARLLTKLQARGLNATVDPSVPSRISVLDATDTTPTIDPTLPNNFVSDVPGTTGGAVGVLVNNAMNVAEVRDAIRTSIAATFNVPGQEANIDAVRFDGSSIFLWNKSVTNVSSPLGFSSSLQGDEFGERNSGPTNQVGLGAQRGQNNRFEGVYIDDIIVGFAERGEMVTYEDNSTASVTTFVDNPQHEPAAGYEEVETGTYQIEIRRGPTYGVGTETFPELIPVLSFDTNDRHAQEVSIIAPSGADIGDGQTFQLSDGIDTVTFEYDDLSIVGGANDGVAQGNIRIPFQSTDAPEVMARRLRDAINSPETQAVLNVVAGLSDGTATGTTNLGQTTGSRVVAIHGTVASDNQGSNNFDGIQQFTISQASTPGFVLYGVDTFKPTETGDSNRERDQGQILVQNNIVRDSSTYGIVVDAGARISGLAPLAGALPHPGAVRNLVQFNQTDLIPGPVLVNNLVFGNAVGGILFSGDNRSANTPEAPMPFGRVVNNTVVGNGSGTGINVTNFASPTLLNNVVASFQTGIQVDASSSSTVVGGTTYQNNGIHATAGLGTDPQVLGPAEPLFVNAAGRNYYLADGSRAIDSSVDSLNDRQEMTTVRDPLGIAVSPILAPDVDLTGQLRVDDPNISNPNGTGGNPFKDRGAYDRADFFGPIAIIQQPLDNDPDQVDSDRTNTFIQIAPGQIEALDFFSILLFEDQGTGPDPATVTSDAVVLTENGRLLEAGVDYIFGYNPSSRLIRLTPLAGIWRNDSVYEITLNNRDGIRISAPAGASITEGDTFSIDAGGTVLDLEFDSDGTVSAGAIAVPFDATMSRYEVASQLMAVINAAGSGLGSYLQGDSTLMVTGATSISGIATTSVGAITDVAGHPLQANRINSLTQFTIVMPEVELDYGDAPQPGHLTVMTDLLGDRSIDVSRHTILPIDAPKLTLGTHVDGEPDGQPNVSATGDDIAAAAVTSTNPNVVVSIAGGAVLSAQAASPAIDGQRITITDPTLQTVTFEFDTAPNPGVVAPGSIRVAVSLADTAAGVAAKLRDAVNQAVLDGHIEGLNAFATGAIVDLGGSSEHVFDFSASVLAVTRIGQSDFDVALPGDINDYADGDLISITGTSGRTIQFELNDTNAGGGLATDGAVSVDVDLSTATPQDVADALAAAINAEVGARRLSLAPVEIDGLTLNVSGDDEDGISFGGLFNANSKPVPVTVTTTGSGILDVWFDWNGDGDFDDAGERIDSVSNLPVRSGSTTILIDTPDIAQATAEAFQSTNPGQRFFVASRFRLSTNGTPLIGEVGIGGEVEDYMVEIVVGAPPVAVDDNYEVREDEVLVVPPLGILTNDTDPDHAVTDLQVVDEDRSTPEVDIVKDADRGVLQVNADGSFTYTPDPDFFGVDTFVYNVTDPRLLSELPATVTITVHEVNDEPTAIDDEITIYEDQSILRPGADFTANDLKGVAGTPSQTNELGQELTVINAVILHPDQGVVGGSVSVAGNELVFTPPAHYNQEIDGPVQIELTIQDNGQTYNTTTGMLEDDFKTSVSTLTINVLPLNDSPVFTMPTQVAVDEDAGPQTVDPFIENIGPAPDEADDEALGPAVNFEDQQVSFTVTAQDPSLFASGPAIDANGVLTYELNPDVTSQAPFPSEILVEVTAVDTGLGETVLTNNFDPAQIAPGTLNTYDGSTFTVTDTEGNVVVFEFDDVNLPGVGSTGGVPHVAISIDPAVDTQASISQALADAIGNPPAASIASGGAGDWAVTAFVDAVTGEIRLIGDASVASAPGVAITTLTNQFTALNAGESYDGATFTITDADGDAIIFELNDTTDTAPATPGVTAGNAPIDYDPSFTQAQLTQAIHDAINNPPPAIVAGLAGTWDVQSTLPAGSDQLRLTGVSLVDIPAATTPIVNPLTSESWTPLDNPVDSRAASSAVTRTFTIVPTAINDAPEFDISVNPINTTEDEGLVTAVDFITGAQAGPSTALDELAAQSLTLTVTAVDPTAFSVQPAVVFDDVAGTATLTFATAADVNDDTGHDLRILVTLTDDGGTVHPLDVDTTVQTLTLSVAPINDAPSFNLPVTEITVFEDHEDVTGDDPTVFVGFAENPMQGPATAVDETTLPATQQQLTFVTISVSDPTLFEVQPTITPTGDLNFKTADDQNGTAVVVVRLLDDGVGPETGNGDDNQARPDQTFTINVAAVNDPPEFTIPATTSSQEDQGLVQVPGFAANLRPGPTTAGDEAGQEFTVHVEAVDPSAFAVQPEIAADGTLTYQMAADVNSDNNSNLQVRVYLTDEGTAGPLPDNNRSETQTFTILVDPVNDAPQFTLSQPSVSVIEDTEDFLGTTTTTIPGVAANIVPGPSTATDEATQQVQFEIVSVSAPELFDVQPSISATTGDLTFTTAQHKNGIALVVVRLLDDGPNSPAPNTSASGLQTLTITVSPINDAPQFNLPSPIVVNEDAGLVSRNGFATDVRRGPVGTDDENNQLLTFEVTAADPNSFAVQPSIGPDGTLTFQTAPDVNSASGADLRVEVRLVDSGVDSPAPNENASAVQTFTISVTPVNDDPITDDFVANLTEDQSIEIQAADVLVGDLAGPTVDEVGTQALTMTQIERTSQAGGTITPVFQGAEIVSFTYTPPANLVGTDTFLYVVSDDGTPSRSGTGTITINIAGINDAPQFQKGPDQTVPEDADLVTVTNWATSILAGPPSATDEHTSQTVSFTASNDNQGLFEVQPAVDGSGTLSFKPLADANGTAVVTVSAVDDGSNVAPNVNTSAPQTFTITITPVNDAPVFTAGANVAVNEDSGPYSQPWATGIAPAAGLLDNPATATDESGQVVDFSVNVDNPALFSVQPTISSTGQLQFTPARDAFGSVELTVTAVDRGPVGGLDQNTSAPQTFTITINAVNDPPEAVGDNYSTDENQVLSVPAPGLLGNDTDVDLPGDSLTAVATTTTSSLGAVVTINQDGSITYDPSAVTAIQQLTTGQSVLDSFVYEIEDSSSTTSLPATVTINVAGVDDAPVAVDDTYSIGVGQTRLLDVLSNDTDIDSAIDLRTITITTIPIFGTATVNQTGVIEYAAGPGFRGIDTLGYTVRDVAGNVSNEAIVTITVNNAPNAADDSTFTFKNEPIEIDVLSNDSDLDGTIDPNSVEVVVSPTPGGTTEVLSGGVIRFTPALDFAGQAQFSYVVSDDIGTTSNVADVLVRVQNSKWQNPRGSLDVNADGFVTPIDALIVINYLNSGGIQFLPDAGITPPPFLDPSGDENVSSLDALLVINFLNQNAGGGEGEAELTSEAYVMTVTPEQIVETVGPQIVREIQASLDESLMSTLEDDNLDAGSVPFIGPVHPSDHRDSTFADDDLVDSLAADLRGSGAEDAVDEFFGLIGPRRPR